MKSFDDYRKELTMPQLLVSANCCRHAFEAGQQSKQTEVDELWKRIDEVIEYIGTDFDDFYTGVMVESIHKILKGDQS